MSARRPLSERLAAAVARPPYRDELGHKGWFERISRAQPHRVVRHALAIPGWPRLRRPLRIAFLSDFHVGSHAGDVARLAAIVAEANAFAPDLALFGGDYVNLQLLGGGRVSPRTIAGALARIEAPCGRFAILGNHDYAYGEAEVTQALRECDVAVLDHARATIAFEGHGIDVLGVPDAHMMRHEAAALLARPFERPSIVLTHDPVWFKAVPAAPIVTLAGHTHGGQIKLPGLGIVYNASKAPRRWSHGLVVEDGRHLYVTAGLGTSLLPLRIGVPPEYAVLDVTGA